MLPLDAIHALVRKSVIVHANNAFRGWNYSATQS